MNSYIDYTMFKNKKIFFSLFFPLTIYDQLLLLSYYYYYLLSFIISII